MSFAGRNVSSAFELAQKILQAKDIQELVRMQTEFVQSQMNVPSEQVGLHNGHDRRRLYERGRNALVSELRAVRPPLSESVIAKERLAFEEAIRKVEAEAARGANESD